MNQAYLHLLLNHVPVLGGIVCVLLLAIGMLRRSREVTTIALLGIVATALLTIPVYLTGEPAEDIVEGLPGVTSSIVHEHEEAAEWAFVLMEVTGAVALLALLLGRRNEPPRRAVLATAVILLVTMAAIIRTASLGGEIRHTEIRSGAAPASAGHDDD